MHSFFFIAMAGVSGLLSPLLKMSTERKCENNSFTLNVTIASKLKPDSIFTNRTILKWKNGWRLFGSSPKFKNTSSETSVPTITTTEYSLGKTGWFAFGHSHRMKWRQKFENFKESFRSETHSTTHHNVRTPPRGGGSHSQSGFVNITTRPIVGKNVSRNSATVASITKDGELHKVAEIVSDIKAASSHQGPCIDDIIIKNTEREVVQLTEHVRNLTEVAQSANQEADRAEHEAEKLEVDVRRLEKEIKLLTRSAEARLKLHNELAAKSTDFQREETEAKRKRMRAENINSQLRRKKAELSAAQIRVKQYQNLRTEVRDSYEESRIIEATKREAHQLAVEIGQMVAEVGKAEEGAGTKQESARAEKEHTERDPNKEANANEHQLKLSTKAERSNLKMLSKTKRLERIRARLRFFEDLQKAEQKFCVTK